MAMPISAPARTRLRKHLVAVATSTAYHLQNIHAYD